MSHKIIWSQRAASDLHEIKKYISFDKTNTALQFIQKIKTKVDRLKKFPQSGRLVPELKRKNIREIIIDHYRVIYKIDKKNIFILTVFESHKRYK